jgi:uncharacterized protein (DUF1499 family)
MRILPGKRPTDLGVSNGRLKPAPQSPNAVSSQADDVQHRIAPLTYRTTAAQARTALVKIIEGTPRTKIITQSADYLYAEYESALFGFVDDVELHFEPGSKVIQVRSASRVGHSDFGVNRARIEDIRRRLLESGA